MTSTAMMNPHNDFLENHGRLLIDSFIRQTKRPLPKAENQEVVNPSQLFGAHYAVVSHDTQQTPVFNYANKTALKLFELNWQDFTTMPSHKSAEAVTQFERDRLLSEVSQKGFIDNYQGIRISASGRRFKIEEAVVWNIVDESRKYHGQAALLSRWMFV